MLKGIDISSFQGKIDFSILKSEVDFIIIKATEGNGFIDPEFKNNQNEVRSQNIPLGYYHFARPDLGNTPEQEASYFWKIVGDPKEGEFFCLDYEVNYSDPVGWCKKFLDHLSSLLEGYKPLIYLNLSLANGHDWSSIINSDYGLWLAHYDGTTDHNDPTDWNTVAFKQYSSTGTIKGISGNVDLDVFYGDLTALKAYGYNYIQVSAPAPIVWADQTLIPFGGELGNLDLGTVRSKIVDNENQILNLITELSRTQTSTGIRINDLQEQLDNCKSGATPTLTFSSPLANFFYSIAKSLG